MDDSGPRSPTRNGTRNSCDIAHIPSPPLPPPQESPIQHTLQRRLTLQYMFTTCTHALANRNACISGVFDFQLQNGGQFGTRSLETGTRNPRLEIFDSRGRFQPVGLWPYLRLGRFFFFPLSFGTSADSSYFNVLSYPTLRVPLNGVSLRSRLVYRGYFGGETLHFSPRGLSVSVQSGLRVSLEFFPRHRGSRNFWNFLHARGR